MIVLALAVINTVNFTSNAPCADAYLNRRNNLLRCPREQESHRAACPFASFSLTTTDMSRRVAATIFAAPARSRAWQRSACKGDLLTAVPRNRDVFTHSTHLQIRSFHPSLYIFAEEKSSEGTSEYSSPIARYSALVDSGLLREDSHQREVVGMLEKLHDELKTYEHKVRPESETVAKTKGGGGLVSLKEEASLF